MEKVLIVGAGFMGSGIAQVSAQAGYQVHLMDIQTAITDRASRRFAGLWRSWRSKVSSRNPGKRSLRGFHLEKIYPKPLEVDWIIEAATEAEELKRSIFQELDRISRPDTPLATNTSSIPITRLAQNTLRPERVLGLHFFGPVPLMGLVEVVKGEKTSAESLRARSSLCSIPGENPYSSRTRHPRFCDEPHLLRSLARGRGSR